MKKGLRSKTGSKVGGAVRRLGSRNWWRGAAALKALAHLAEDRPSYGNKIRLIFKGDELYEAMIADIGAAREQVLFEIYMIGSDACGWRMVNALSEKAKEGVEVRVIYDSAGSWDADEKIFAVMREAGVHVVEFRPLKPWRKRFGFFGRNHRKIAVIDQKIGYIGGFNVADLWSEQESEGVAWRDTHVRLEGCAVKDLSALFVDTWRKETGVDLASEEIAEGTEDSRCSKSHDGAGGVCVIGRRGKFRSKIRRLYLLQILKAEKHLFIEHSYFVPDRSIRKGLMEAAKHGVDVRVVVPEKSDIQLADNASRYYFERFLKNGIRIYLWKPSVLHAKVTIVDGGWASVGSGNFDHLSLDHNLEANALILDASAVDQLTDHFWDDLEQCAEVDLEEWRKRSRTQRGKERLARLFRPWL